jgi:hypothetical protein
MPTIHLLNQFVWPDAAPTAVYAEQLADELLRRGHEVRLVGTAGTYRSLERPRPAVPVRLLAGFRSARSNLAGVFLEYASAHRLFARYIRSEVAAGDVVVATSAPPPTPWLLGAIRSRRARAVYWLQDYYPELVRSLWEYPTPARHAFRARWDQALSGWDVVMKIGANLGYAGSNAVVRRNWAPFEFSESERASHPCVPRTALYAGNFGYAHDRDSFVREGERLRADGYRITVRGDGPGVRQLPEWIECGPVFPDAVSLRAALLEAEIHLVAAHPSFTEALFPSKLWKSLAAGRRVIGTGFAGVMEQELHDSLASDFRGHLAAAADTVETHLA